MMKKAFLSLFLCLITALYTAKAQDTILVSRDRVPGGHAEMKHQDNGVPGDNEIYLMVVSDYNHDGFADTMYYAKSTDNFGSVWFTDGSGPHHYHIELSPEDKSQMISLAGAPAEWLSGKNHNFITAVSSVFERSVQYRQPDPSLIYLIQANATVKPATAKSIYKSGYRFTENLADEKELLHRDNGAQTPYFTFLSGDSFAALCGGNYNTLHKGMMPPNDNLTEVGHSGNQSPDSCPASGWVLYKTWCHWMCMETGPRAGNYYNNQREYKIDTLNLDGKKTAVLTGCHSLYLLQDHKIKCVFATGNRFIDGPEKLRWPGVDRAIAFHDLLIVNYGGFMGAAKIIIIDTKRNKAGVLNIKQPYPGGADFGVGNPIVKGETILINVWQSDNTEQKKYTYDQLKKGLDEF